MDTDFDSQGGVPIGWKLCYIDNDYTSYQTTQCQDLIRNVKSYTGVIYSNFESLLLAGGNFGCWSGSTGAYSRTSACQMDHQHTGAILEQQALYLCIKFPSGNDTIVK